MDTLVQKYIETRQRTLKTIELLKSEDLVVQSTPEASPPKWHLGHTSWFFDKLILEGFCANYATNERYSQIFNSYYKSFGLHDNKANRGMFSRPTITEVLEYRKHIDESILSLLQTDSSPEISDLIILGINHEQQHQELLLMDIKSIFFSQKVSLAFLPSTFKDLQENNMKSEAILFEGGLCQIGMEKSSKNQTFRYDNEEPSHRIWISPFKIDNRLVTNGEFLEFVESDGYQRHEFWLSDGWDWIRKEQISSPLYWTKLDGCWFEFTFNGFSALSSRRPVSHISYYEAQAYARFRDKRLPTEQEWEFLAQHYKPTANHGFLSTNKDFPPIEICEHFSDLHGQLWQWTQSSYLPYPGHQWVRGPLGEYNSKFMINQMVLRGGSIGTDFSHYRITYRNFFYPHNRWHFSGLRLAENP